jgi:hypothetical protein
MRQQLKLCFKQRVHIPLKGIFYTKALCGTRSHSSKFFYQIQIQMSLRSFSRYWHVFVVCDYRRDMDWIMGLLAQLGTTCNYSIIADLHTLQTTSKRQVFSVFDCRVLATDYNTLITSVSL